MAEHVIEAEGLTRHYRLGGRTVSALEDVSLRIEPGDYVAVTGPTGSGKTTLMKILGCLDRPSTGRYRLNGIDVAGLTADRMADTRNRVLGFLFQSFVLLPQSTALENVEMPLAYAGVRGTERRQRAREALARVGLADREDHAPGGCPAASSNAWRSPEPSSTSQVSCLRMNRPAPSTTPRLARCCVCSGNSTGPA